MLLTAVNILLYVNTIHSDFLKDDFQLIVENQRLKDFHSFWDTIGTRFFSFPYFPYLHYWRPVSMFSFYLDYQIWGLNPAGYHLFNLVINVGNALLLFFIFFLLFRKIHYALVGSTAFSIHPCHTETVSWISGRTDLLSAFFIFSAILFFIFYIKKKKPYYYGLTALFFILSLLSKENGMVFPLLALGLIFIVPKTEAKKPVTPSSSKFPGNTLKKFLVTLPFWMIDIIFFIFHNRFSDAAEAAVKVSFRDVPVVAKTIGAYTKAILIPFFPTPHFPMHLFDRLNLEYLTCFGLAGGILAFMAIKRKEFKNSIYALLFLFFILPVLDPEIIPSHPQIAIRFVYIPVAFAGILAIDTFHFIKNRLLKHAYAGLLLIIALIWGIESYSFQAYFKDGEQHYDRLIRFYPDDCSLILPSALNAAQKRDYRRALALINHALEVNDQNRWLDISETGGLLKANLLVIAGDPDTGKALAEKIIKDNQEDEIRYFGNLVLSKYYEKTGKLPQALDMLKKAGGIGETADLFFKMATLYGKMGNHARALHYIEKAIDFNPRMKVYHDYRALLLQEQVKKVSVRY